jgi:glycosyltransferase involved in cell wall biosynthesis
MIHVTHVVAHPPFREGTGTACYYNARALHDLGCGVTVYAPRYKLRDGDRQLDFYRFMPCWLTVENAFLTPELLSIEKTDILHLHYPFIFGAELLMAKAVAAKLPMVVTYHNDLIGGGIRRPAFFIYNRLNAPLILARARKIAVVSLDHADSSLYGKTLFRTRRDDIVDVGNGVDVEQFRPDLDPRPVRSRYRIGADDRVLLFVANLDRAHVRKGLPLVLEVLSALPNRAIKLLVAGDGEMRGHYEERATALGIRDRVIFAGRIPHDQLPAFYAASDLVVVPSRPPESFGLALAEGMASGKPVIGCNIPGVRMLVRDGETGFLIEPGDTAGLARRIELLVQNDDLRDAMGHRSHQRIIQHFTWNHVGERLLAMYDDVLFGQTAVTR